MSDLDTVLAGLGRHAAGTARIDVDADLRLEITTARGVTAGARITGSGQHLRVETERPRAFLVGVDRATAGRMAELLAATGITVDVVGPAGRLATLGAGASSRLGRLTSGSSRIAPRPWAAAQFAAGIPEVQVVAALAVAAVVAAVARRTTRTGNA